LSFTPIKPYGDYHITSTSPAIDLASGAFVAQFTELAQDFDNETRPNGAAHDVGADEFYATGFARIIVQKATVGGDNVFTFTPNYGAAFTLSNGQSNDSGALAAGTYSVTEAVPAGWQQTSATCSDGSNPGSINLAAGETGVLHLHQHQTRPDHRPQGDLAGRATLRASPSRRAMGRSST